MDERRGLGPTRLSRTLNLDQEHLSIDFTFHMESSYYNTPNWVEVPLHLVRLIKFFHQLAVQHKGEHLKQVLYGTTKIQGLFILLPF